MSTNRFFKTLVLTAALFLMLIGCALAEEGFPESAHPYQNHSNVTWTYEHPSDTYALKITFSEKTEFENNCDYLYIIDENGDSVEYTGTALAGETIYVPGSNVNFRLKSDGSYTRYGFSITSIVGVTQEEYDAYVKEYEESFLVTGFAINASGTITDYTGSDTEVVVPSMINGIRVKRIGSSAFYGCKNIKSITLPEGVTSIGNDTFYNCSSLTSITLPEGVTSIGYRAFYNCSSLKHIMMSGSSVPSFGSNVFYRVRPTIYCYEFSEVDFWATENGYKTVYLDSMDMQTPTDIQLPKDCKLEIGQEITITPAVFPAIENPKITWESSAPEVVSVEDGVLTALSLGQATITAKCGNLSDEMVITTLSSVKSFTLSETEMWIASKETAQISIENKLPENTTSEFSYECSDTSVLSVSSSGKVTAKTPGDAAITVTSDNGISQTCTVHVCYPVTAIEFRESTVTLLPGENVQLTADVTAREQSYVNKLVSFASSDESIAEVDKNGVVTAIAPGKATITASSSNGVSAQCTVEVHCENHIEVIDEAVAPTCTEPGLTEGSHCSVCGKVFKAQEVIPVSGHTEEVIEGVPATCTETGSTEGVKCTVCNEIIKAQEEIPALGHNEQVIDSKPATCTETGLTEGSYCDVCGKVFKAREVVPALGHIEEAIRCIAPTCTEPGLTEGTKCAVCGVIIKEQAIIPAVGHDEGHWTIVSAPTTVMEGLKERRCTVCKTVLATEAIPKIELDYDSVPDPVVQTVKAKAGETVTLNVYVSSLDACVVIVQLNYDSEIFEIISLTCDSGEAANGKFAAYSLSETVNGKIGTVTMKVKESAADGEYTVSANVLEAYNLEEEPVACKASADKVKVANVVSGDASGDGVVDGRDLIRLAKYLGGYDVDIDPAGASVNGDDVVDGRDLIRLAKYLGGHDVTLE